MKVTKINTKDDKYPDILNDVEHHVLEITVDDYRVVNTSNRPFLYPKHIFRVTDDNMVDWIEEWVEDEELGCSVWLRISPKEFAKHGFWCNFFDGDTKCKRIYKKYLEKIDLERTQWVPVENRLPSIKGYYLVKSVLDDSVKDYDKHLYVIAYYPYIGSKIWVNPSAICLSPWDIYPGTVLSWKALPRENQQ